MGVCRRGGGRLSRLLFFRCPDSVTAVQDAKKSLEKIEAGHRSPSRRGVGKEERGGWTFFLDTFCTSFSASAQARGEEDLLPDLAFCAFAKKERGWGYVGD